MSPNVFNVFVFPPFIFSLSISRRAALRYQRSAARTRDKVEPGTSIPRARARACVGFDKIFFPLRCTSRAQRSTLSGVQLLLPPQPPLSSLVSDSTYGIIRLRSFCSPS